MDGITLGIATPLLMIGLFGWVFSAMALGGRKLLGSTGTMSGPKTTPGGECERTHRSW